MTVAASAAVWFVVTAYAPGCGGDGLTKLERFPHHERTAATDPRVIPMLSEIYIEGIGVRYAEDTGRNIKGHRVDVFMEDCKAARKFGRRRLRVKRIR